MNNYKNSDKRSVRPKIRGKHSTKLIGEPLERRSIRFEDRDGIERYYPALHFRFSHSMIFIKYTIPYFKTIDDLENDNEIEKWITNVNSYEEMLKTLLRLPHNQFWSTLVYEKSLQISLESYLRSGPRDHDFHNLMITDQMKSAVKRVHILIFKLYLRISSFAESKTSFISENTFGALIYDNYLFDIPKIIDLSVLFGNTNCQNLLIKMFLNVIQCQPRYLEDILKSCTNISEALNLIQDKLGIDDNKFDTTSKLNYFNWSELQSIIINITDISVSLRMLLISIPQTANIYRKASIEKTIVEFYNRVFPLLQKELNNRFASLESNNLIIESIKNQILIARWNFIQTFRDIVRICFYDQLFDENTTSDSKLILIEELIDVLTLASYEKSFIKDYCSEYPVEKDFEWLSNQSEITKFKVIDKTRIDYLISIINGYFSDKTEIAQISEDLNDHKLNGFANAEEINEINGIDIELESQIQYIHEIIPDLGPGFIEKCLEFYNLDNEKVLNAILEDNLPLQLSKLDRSLQKVPKKSLEKPINNKVIEEKDCSLQFSSANPMPKLIDERRNVYNDDEFDIFRNKNVDLSRIHLGKKEKIIPKLDLKDKEKIIAIHNKALEDEEREEIEDYYNDEYDDTYEDDTRIDLPNDKLMDELVSQQSSKLIKNSDNTNNDSEVKHSFNSRKPRYYK